MINTGPNYGQRMGSRSNSPGDRQGAFQKQFALGRDNMQVSNGTYPGQYQTNTAPRVATEQRTLRGSYQGIINPNQMASLLSPNSQTQHSQQNQQNLRNTTSYFDSSQQKIQSTQMQANYLFSPQTVPQNLSTSQPGYSQNQFQGFAQSSQMGSSNSYNAFDLYHNVSKQQGQTQYGMNNSYAAMPYNNQQQMDPHQALFNQPFQNISGIPMGALNQNLLGPNIQGGDLSQFARQQSWEKTDDEAVKQHQNILEENTLNQNAFKKLDGSDPFHGKSIRSIQLFNQPTAASPRLLHPRQNPMVKADSPRAKPLPFAPARAASQMLDIHADSCYNFLNKRRFAQADETQTPLETFFLKESLSQYKVASALAKRQVNLKPTKIPPPVKRSKRYLLVLDIDETLVHSDPVMANSRPTPQANKQFDKTCRFENGDGTHDIYGVKFRPYMMEFIQRMSKLYDLAVYTASAKDYADVVMDCVDPSRTIFCTRLYRDNCLPVNGMNIKNMSNFEGPDVFIVDNLIYSYAYHMNQGIPICAFVDDPMDVELQDLAEILENLPFYESLPALLQDLLGLDEFYQNLSVRVNSRNQIR